MSFFSISGVILDCKKRLDVLVCISDVTPVKLGANDLGLLMMSIHSCSNSGIRATYCRTRRRSRPMTQTSANLSKKKQNESRFDLVTRPFASPLSHETDDKVNLFLSECFQLRRHVIFYYPEIGVDH